MYKYPFILLISLAALSNLQGQTIINHKKTSNLEARFERVNDAIPRMAELYYKGKLTITALQNNDSTATFQIEEEDQSSRTIVEDEKELNRLLSPLNKDPYKPGIYILTNHTLKDKKISPRPPKKELFITGYTVIWNLTLRKVKDKQTEVSLTYKSLSPAFAKKIEREFKSDVYYKNVINKIVVNDKLWQEIKGLLIKELQVEKEPAAPNGF